MLKCICLRFVVFLNLCNRFQNNWWLWKSNYYFLRVIEHQHEFPPFQNENDSNLGEKYIWYRQKSRNQDIIRIKSPRDTFFNQNYSKLNLRNSHIFQQHTAGCSIHQIEKQNETIICWQFYYLQNELPPLEKW